MNLKIENARRQCYDGASKDMLLPMNLKIENSREQCYDEASAMSRTKSGVVTQLKLLRGKFLFTPCYGNPLNLAVGDC